MDAQTCPGTYSHPLDWVWVAVTVVVGTGAFLYWALEFYLLEALLGTSKVEVEWYRDSPVTKLAAKHCKSLTRGRYRSPFLICSPHLQTVYLALERGPKVTYKREVVIQTDGGSVGLDFAGADSPAAPTVVITPGLTSDSTPPYVRYLVAAIVKQGWRAVVINHRGLGGVALTSNATHNAGWTTDIRETVALLGKRYPGAPLAVAGCSLGANMTIRYLGEEGDKTPVVGAFTVGSPYDMLIVDRFCNRKFLQKVWIRLMVDGMKEYADKNWDVFGKVVDRAHVMASRNVHEFDDRVVRVIAKYETVDSYYRQSSCAPFVTSVRVPLLAVSALDDPICTREAIPRDEIRLNPNVVLATAARGGHLAIYEGWLPTQIWWTKPCVEFLGAVFEKAGKK